jgi:hypothetical protein
MAGSGVPLVFVVGTGRCGTHTLWRVFESLPATLSTHEGVGTVRSGPPSFVGKRLALGCMPEFNAYLYHYASEETYRRTFDPDTEMTAFMDGSFAGRSTSVTWCETNGIAYCDANPFAFNFVNYIHAKYPRARFIHLVRDGYACVRSWSRREVSTYPDGLPSADSISWLLAKPVPFRSDPAHAAWSDFDRVQKLSWFWSTVNANLAERFSRLPSASVRVVKIEEVTEATLPGLLEFCGLPQKFAPESLAPADRSSGPTFAWTPDNTRKFNALAGPMMERLGYAIRA